MATAAERKAAERERRRASGFKAYEVWVRPDKWPLVKRLVEKLAKQVKP